ncbi:MAG: hypothetical protein SGJ00_10660 [bacterium]|nr:hypothetical protein [bacterium]
MKTQKIITLVTSQNRVTQKTNQNKVPQAMKTQKIITLVTTQNRVTQENTHNRITKKISLLILLFLNTLATFAQPEFDDDIVDTPVDGITRLLLLSAISYGARKIKKRQNNRSQATSTNL